MPAKKPVIVRWEPFCQGTGLPEGEGLPAAYRAYDEDDSCNAQWAAQSDAPDLRRALMDFEVFGAFEVVAIETFRNDDERDYWAAQHATRVMGRWLASPQRPQGDVYSSARHLLTVLADAGLSVRLMDAPVIGD